MRYRIYTMDSMDRSPSRDELNNLSLNKKLFKTYTGNELKSGQAFTISDSDVEYLLKLYRDAEKIEIGKTLTDSIITTVAKLGCFLFKIKNVDDVVENLKRDKFTVSAIDKVSIYSYSSFGFFLAPITAGGIFYDAKIKEVAGTDALIIAEVIDDTLSI